MALTTEQVSAFLTEHLGPAVNEVQPVLGGASSQAFSYMYSGTEHIARFSSREEDFLKDELAASFAGPGLPIPHVTEIGEGLNGYFALSDRVPGRMLDGLNQHDMEQAVPSVLELLDGLRNAEITALKGYGRWNGKGIGAYDTWQEHIADAGNDNIDSRMHGWKDNLAASPIGLTGFNQALEQLQKLVHFCPEDAHLIHSDLLYKNVLIEEGHVTGVIDWGNSMRGDFLYDLAWLSFWSPWYHAMKDINWEQRALEHYKSIGFEVPDFKERMLCYKLHIGIDAQGWNAYQKNWDQLKAVTDKTLALLW
ncbi:MAG TPA: phosphotransferase [Candidatus Saccharimonadales bacterium]|nr:phosphotransferase [Candidatus Saccharimonadales bacterium]